ncbi:MAG: sugar phosphate isomerase/epimerase [Mariniblastus sp.]|jgi:sugar phosphate isomerase/epimerase
MLQLKKSIRLESLRQPFKKALVTAASLGADAVEINGLTEVRPAEMSRTAVRHLRKLLADLNLQVSAIHFPTRRGYDNVDDLDRRVDATKSTLTMAYELGCNVVVNRIGRVPEDTAHPSWNTMVQALSDIGNFSQKSGAWLAARSGGESGESLKRLIDSLPVHSLVVDFDAADFLINGHSPTESMKILGEHVMSFRARDAVNDLSQGRGVEVQLGRGSVDWASLLGTLEEHNYQGFLTIERESEQNSIVEVGQAIEYLTNLFG